MTQTYKRYSDDPVEIGMVRYVGMDDPYGPTYCCIVTQIDGDGLGKKRFWDEEFRCWSHSYVYLCRRATPEEEAAYNARARGAEQRAFRATV